jgi:hypothetical protein
VGRSGSLTSFSFSGWLSLCQLFSDRWSSLNNRCRAEREERIRRVAFVLSLTAANGDSIGFVVRRWRACSLGNAWNASRPVECGLQGIRQLCRSQLANRLSAFSPSAPQIACPWAKVEVATSAAFRTCIGISSVHFAAKSLKTNLLTPIFRLA